MQPHCGAQGSVLCHKFQPKRRAHATPYTAHDIRRQPGPEASVSLPLLVTSRSPHGHRAALRHLMSVFPRTAPQPCPGPRDTLMPDMVPVWGRRELKGSLLSLWHLGTPTGASRAHREPLIQGQVQSNVLSHPSEPAGRCHLPAKPATEEGLHRVLENVPRLPGHGLCSDMKPHPLPTPPAPPGQPASCAGGLLAPDPGVRSGLLLTQAPNSPTLDHPSPPATFHEVSPIPGWQPDIWDASHPPTKPGHDPRDQDPEKVTQGEAPKGIPSFTQNQGRGTGGEAQRGWWDETRQPSSSVSRQPCTPQNRQADPQHIGDNTRSL